jgi:hypothetical protein
MSPDDIYAPGIFHPELELQQILFFYWTQSLDTVRLACCAQNVDWFALADTGEARH